MATKKSATTGTKAPARKDDKPKIRSSHARATTKPAASSAKSAKKRKDPLVLPVEPARTTGPRSKRTKELATAGGPSIASDVAREMAVTIAIAALEKKAVGLEILDVAGRVDYADFLVLMSGRSDRQVAALAAGIEEALRKTNKRPASVEGLPHANWVLMDFGDVVVHVFQENSRSLYDIEGLWMDARRVPVPDDGEEQN